ncbi:hypothetical protein N8703_00475 [Verrucomicrobia bacterium]|nr:hypothetical protein [Verrucomicrobiota bacterium]
MIFEAELFDATRLVLSQPLSMPAGTKVVLEIIETSDPTVHDEFLSASAALLEVGYGDEEPDYFNEGKPL